MLSKVFCLRLFTLGMIIGNLGMLVSLLVAITAAISFVLLLTDQDQERYSNIDTTPDIITNGISIGLAMLSFLAHSLLVLGVMKELHWLLLPWLVMFGISLGFSIYGYLFLCFVLPYPSVFIFMFLVTLGLALKIYIYYGIYSLYKEIKLSKEEKLQDYPDQYDAVAYQDNLIPNNI